MAWVPLHQHSQFSILDATASIRALVQKGAEYEMSAMALTDQGNLHGAVDFYRELLQSYAKELICLSGPQTSKIASLIAQGKEKEVSEELDFFSGLFGEVRAQTPAF